jgi:hypothetical protein
MRQLLAKGQVAQLVEQRTENPCVGGSIPSLATKQIKGLRGFFMQALYLFGVILV